MGVAEDDDLIVTGRPRTARLSSPKSLWVNSNGTDGGVLASLGEGLPSVEGVSERLVPLLSSIGG
jgi:hypothetical protein